MAFGKVCGSFADGFTSPNSNAAIALPSSWPGYQAWRTPFTPSAHGISIGPPVSSTTTVLGFAFETVSISASWLPDGIGEQPARLQFLAFDRDRSGRSL